MYLLVSILTRRLPAKKHQERGGYDDYAGDGPNVAAPNRVKEQ